MEDVKQPTKKRCKTEPRTITIGTDVFLPPTKIAPVVEAGYRLVIHLRLKLELDDEDNVQTIQNFEEHLGNLRKAAEDPDAPSELGFNSLLALAELVGPLNQAETRHVFVVPDMRRFGKILFAASLADVTAPLE